MFYNTIWKMLAFNIRILIVNFFQVPFSPPLGQVSEINEPKMKKTNFC